MQLPKPTDFDIWTKFKYGDNDALSLIFTENSSKLYRFGLKLTSNQSVVEDVIQDLFSDLIRKRKNLGDTNNILFYLIKSFKRRLQREIQKEMRHNLQGEKEELTFTVTYSIEHAIIQDEITDQKVYYIRQALNKLSSRQKEAIYLRFTEEFKYEQIAEIMNLSIEGSRNLIYRAIRSLREDFQTNKVMLFFMLRHFI